jgi:hypothetical protein
MPRLLSTRVGVSALVALAACTGRGEAGGSTASDTQAGQSGAAASAEAATVVAQTESFERFWPAFRQAILAGDKGKIVAVTRFPFETRGPSDDDPVRQHDRAAFPALLDSLLTQQSGSMSGGTTRQLIERTTTLTARNVAPGGKEARVGRFSFQNPDGRWWFTRAYVDE